MNYSALIPFGVLFVSFVFLRLSLMHASFIALLTCTLFSQTLFHATPEMWTSALTNTGIFMIEIGFILIGAFYFIEVALEAGVIDSLASLVKTVSPNRIVQGILVSFPLELMVEGSSGFGTPLLVITPILFALHFPIELCAILPFITWVCSIPFGALGTPIRLGFPSASVASGVAHLMVPFVFLGPLLTFFLIERFDPKHAKGTSRFRTLIWIGGMSVLYALTSQWVAGMGPEFPGLAAGLITFLFGIATAKKFLSPAAVVTEPVLAKNKLGISVYAALLFVLWLGKRIWMDETFPGTHLRVFNPGMIFVLFAIGLTIYFKMESPFDFFRNALIRARRTLFVLLCMTFMVQQLRQNGALELLTSHLPEFLLGKGVPLLGWLGSIFIGTSTMTNLLFSKIVDPLHYAPLAAGSAIGVQLAFQSLAATRAVLNDRLTEKKILSFIAPISLGFMLILILFT